MKDFTFVSLVMPIMTIFLFVRLIQTMLSTIAACCWLLYANYISQIYYSLFLKYITIDCLF